MIKFAFGKGYIDAPDFLVIDNFGDGMTYPEIYNRINDYLDLDLDMIIQTSNCTVLEIFDEMELPLDDFALIKEGQLIPILDLFMDEDYLIDNNLKELHLNGEI